TCRPDTSITRPDNESVRLLDQKLSAIATTSPIIGIIPSRPVAKLTVVLRRRVLRHQPPRLFASLRRVHPIAVMLVGLCPNRNEALRSNTPSISWLYMFCSSSNVTLQVVYMLFSLANV